MAKVSRTKKMEVSAKALFQAITDFESYPKFLSEVVSVKRLPGGSAESQKVLFELEIVKRFQYTLHFRMQDLREVAWTLVESNFFKQNDGRWVLTEAGPKSVDVEYELDVGFGFFVPSWISKKLTEVNLPKMFDGFESRAKEIQKGAK